jgi:hypothetical protein
MIRLKCSKCTKIHEFEDDKLDYELVGSDPDRQMGPENVYSGTLELECDKCSNPMTAEFTFWEYPTMALNNSEHEEEGCTVLEEPDYQSYLNQPDEI